MEPTPICAPRVCTVKLAERTAEATLVRRAAFPTALSMLLLALLLPAASRLTQAATRYDIIVIVTDDQPSQTVRFMPLVNLHIGDNGVRFTNAFASTPLCCPSRASMLTGLYTHNHGVLRNNVPLGGAPKFDDTSTIATWLQGAGYRTGYYGKYLNDYSKMVPWPYMPPGWTEWHAFRNATYYNYTLVENGVEVGYGATAADYSTNVLATLAVQFIETTPAGTPLLLYFAPFAPHAPATPAPGDAGSFAWLPIWRPVSYNETHVSDKPQWVRDLPLLTATEQAQGDAFHRSQVESLQAVDRAVGSLIDALARTGRLANAAIIYTSDHGLSWGEHRWLDKKDCVYEPCVRTPFLVRAPGVTIRSDDHLILNVDLAPTIAEWAGVIPSSNVNGSSFSGLLADPGAPWRTAALLEDLGRSAKLNFFAVRTTQYLYAEYENGDREFYDLQVDPFQLSNAYSNPAYAATIATLQNMLAALKRR